MYFVVYYQNEKTYIHSWGINGRAAWHSLVTDYEIGYQPALFYLKRDPHSRPRTTIKI